MSLSGLRFERSEAIERFNRLERASSYVKRLPVERLERLEPLEHLERRVCCMNKGRRRDTLSDKVK
jgi:hypothetical protein